MAYHSRALTICLSILCGLVIGPRSHALVPNQLPLRIDQTEATGCRLSHAHTGESRNFTMFSEHGGGVREYVVHLPSKYDPGVPLPLILSFHGFTEHMWQHEKLSKFSNESINPNMITIYPQGLGNPPAWEGAPYASNASDLSFTTDLVNHIKATYCINSKEIFATGMSNGGGFVNTLACSPNGSDFAAFAPVAGAFYGDVANGSFQCQAARPRVPILEIHGSNDSIIPYQGGQASGVALPAISDWLKRWATRNGCSSSSSGTTQSLVDGHVQRTSYNCNDSIAIVSGLEVRGLDHCWPSTTPNRNNHNTSTWIDAAPYVLEFFNNHQRF